MQQSVGNTNNNNSNNNNNDCNNNNKTSFLLSRTHFWAVAAAVAVVAAVGSFNRYARGYFFLSSLSLVSVNVSLSGVLPALKLVHRSLTRKKREREGEITVASAFPVVSKMRNGLSRIIGPLNKITLITTFFRRVLLSPQQRLTSTSSSTRYIVGSYLSTTNISFTPLQSTSSSLADKKNLVEKRYKFGENIVFTLFC